MRSTSKIFKTLLGGVLFLSLTLVGSVAFAADVTVFITDFETPVPSEFSGVTTTEGVQGYAGLNVFGDNFLRNITGDNFGGGSPPLKTTLRLTSLPAHTSISLHFLLAIIDSWDGIDCNQEPNPSPSPDYFNVMVDDVLIFTEAFENSGCGTQDYTPFGAVLAREENLGFNPGTAHHLDSAYDMGFDSRFSNIVHAASTLTIEWFASGAGWQGSMDVSNDESWAIDNVEVILNDVAVTLTVDIDIKPGSDPNCFNNDGHGVIPVAILGSMDFNVNDINPATVALESLVVRAVGRSGDRLLAHIEDSNGDGFNDLVVQIEDVDDIFKPGEGVATLTGELFDGTSFEGKDFICIVP